MICVSLIAVACSSTQDTANSRSPIPVHKYASDRGDKGFHKNEPASVRKWSYVTVVDANGNIKKKRFRVERQPNNYPYFPTDLKQKGIYITYMDDRGNVRQRRVKQPKGTNYYGYMPTDLKSKTPYFTKLDGKGNVRKESFKLSRKEVDYHYRPTDLKNKRPYTTYVDEKGNLRRRELKQDKTASNYPYMPTDLKSKRPYVTRMDADGKVRKVAFKDTKAAAYPYMPTDVKSKVPYVTRFDENGNVYKEKLKQSKKEPFYPYLPNDRHSRKPYTYVTRMVNGVPVRVKQYVNGAPPAQYTYTPTSTKEIKRNSKYAIVTYIDKDGKVVKKKVDKRYTLPQYDSMDGEEWKSFRPGTVDTDSSLFLAGVENIVLALPDSLSSDTLSDVKIAASDTLDGGIAMDVDSLSIDEVSPYAAIEKKFKITVEAGDDVALFNSIYKYSGIPYKSGKNTEKGMDAIGLVMKVYQDRYKVSLPRLSAQSLLEMHCHEVAEEELQPGDVVFFSIRNKGIPNHVGIYLKDGIFVHTTRSTGVEAHKLTDPIYYNFFVSGGIISH